MITIGNINEPFNDYIMDKAIEPYNRLKYLSEGDSIFPDTPAIFSKYYVGCDISENEWLNSDILMFDIWPDPPDEDVGDSSHQQPKLLFFSVAKREIIGYIYDKIDEVFVNGNNIICFTKESGIYVVKLNMSYLQNESKKRRLEADLTFDENQSKKTKLK